MVSPLLINPATMVADRIKMLVYGDIGQGKTTFGFTAPNCLMISVEGGETALIRSALAYDPRSRILRVRTMDELRRAYHMIATNADGLGEFDSYFIDSLTDIQDKALFEEITANPKRKRTAPGSPSQEDWQSVTLTMRQMVMRFRDLPKHVIFSALYRNDKNPQTPGGYAGARSIRAELSPAVYKAVSAYMDIVAYITKQQEVNPQTNQPTGRVRRLMVFDDPSMTYSSKSRFSLPPYLEDPTFMKILELIHGGSR